MSRLSENRISHLAHLIVDGLWKGNRAGCTHEGRALAETKRVITEFFQREDDIDELVRRKIMSLSRQIPAGSREWDVLYRKYFEEEKRKQKK